MCSESNNLIEVRNIVKTFPGVKALSNVNLTIRRGEVHALCGENGAGKSTLIKILAGVHPMDSGTYLFEGKPANIHSTREGIDMGISCIYQELSIVPLIDVAKNLFLGNYPLRKNGVLDVKTMYTKAQKVLDRIKLDVSPKTLADDLSIAQQQMVEIGRALTRNAKVIVMDEPTSSLTDQETEMLFSLIEFLKSEGISIIYISHKLEEVLRITDRVTIMRDGETITTIDTKGTTKEQLIDYMIGRPLDNLFNKMQVEKGPVAMKVEGLTKEGIFEDISFEVHQGEVLGFFGLVGAGRTEIMESIFGVRHYDSGKIIIEGEEVKIQNTKQAVRYGVSLVPEDRRTQGLATKLSVLANMTIVKLGDLSKFNVIQRKQQKQIADEYIESIRIKTPSYRQLVMNLSGGNQQKVVIAKWLMAHPKVLILDEPTRGIDVGAKAEIYGLISQLASKGVAVIIVSSELQEIFGCCDRVATICQGKLTAVVDIERVTNSNVLAAAFGGSIT